MRVNSSRLILEVLISLFAGISSANSEQTCNSSYSCVRPQGTILAIKQTLRVAANKNSIVSPQDVCPPSKKGLCCNWDEKNTCIAICTDKGCDNID